MEEDRTVLCVTEQGQWRKIGQLVLCVTKQYVQWERAGQLVLCVTEQCCPVGEDRTVDAVCHRTGSFVHFPSSVRNCCGNHALEHGNHG